MNIEKYNKILFKLAQKAYNKNEVTVSELIVYKNRIIAKAYNKKNIKNNPLLHAEIICINMAAKRLKNWNLNGCTLYVTLEPCDMCKMIISEARIDNVYYLIEKGSINNKYSKTIYEQMFDNTNVSYKELFNNFFNKIRNK